MSAETLPATGSERRYDLDWLRVIAFGFLIFYHIGMFYVTWGWHVKSPHAGPWLEPVMALINPWRLPLLVRAVARLNWGVVRADQALATATTVVRTLFMWAAIAAMLGLAQRYLNRSGPVLRFLTEAVFPYYILHQTLIVAVGFWVGGLLPPVWLEAGIIVVATVGGCVVLTEAIKRIPPLRPLFALPLRAETIRPARQVVAAG